MGNAFTVSALNGGGAVWGTTSDAYQSISGMAAKVFMSLVQRVQAQREGTKKYARIEVGRLVRLSFKKPLDDNAIVELSNLMEEADISQDKLTKIEAAIKEASTIDTMLLSYPEVQARATAAREALNEIKAKADAEERQYTTALQNQHKGNASWRDIQDTAASVRGKYADAIKAASDAASITDAALRPMWAMQARAKVLRADFAGFVE